MANLKSTITQLAGSPMDFVSDAFHDNAGSTAGLLFRPQRVLDRLPIAARWDFTRRHPYYLIWWKQAKEYRSGRHVERLDVLFGQFASEVLLSINLTGDPPSPSESAKTLGIHQLGKAWADSAAAPLTYRVASGILLDLPEEVRLEVGAALMHSCAQTIADRNERADADRRRMAAQTLTSLPFEFLDKIPARPFIGINIYSPLRAIQSATTSLVKGWKRNAGIKESRRRHDVLEDYLKVWDLREAWTGDNYRIADELPFKQIAIRLNVPLRTVISQYLSAFELLTGHPYNISNWCRIFAVVKLAVAAGNKSLARRRVLEKSERSTSSAKTVSQSVFDGDNPTGHGGEAIAADKDLDTNLVIDEVLDLLRDGLSDEQIIQKIGFADPTAGLDMLPYFRRRLAEDPAASNSSPGRRTTSRRSGNNARKIITGPFGSRHCNRSPFEQGMPFDSGGDSWIPRNQSQQRLRHRRRST